MNKKLLALIAAVISTLVSIGLWIYYLSLPSFQDSQKSYAEMQTETFQSSKEALK